MVTGRLRILDVSARLCSFSYDSVFGGSDHIRWHLFESSRVLATAVPGNDEFASEITRSAYVYFWRSQPMQFCRLVQLTAVTHYKAVPNLPMGTSPNFGTVSLGSRPGTSCANDEIAVLHPKALRRSTIPHRTVGFRRCRFVVSDLFQTAGGFLGCQAGVPAERSFLS